MGRPKDADSARTYEQIIQAALDVLHQAGDPQSMSLRVVAAQAGVSSSTIQYYFATKEDLLEACLDGYYERLGELGQALIQAAAESTDPTAYVEASVRELFRFAVAERALIALRLSINTTRRELHPRRQPEFMGSMVRAAAAALAPHVEIDEHDARMAIHAMSVIVVRFALFSESELSALGADLNTLDPRWIEDHVARIAIRLVKPRGKL